MRKIYIILILLTLSSCTRRNGCPGKITHTNEINKNI